MKKLMTVLAGGVLAAALVLPVSASSLYVNGRELWQQSAARVVNDTTYVSLRAAAGWLAPEARVSWDGTAARVEGEGLSLSAVPGQPYLNVNDRVFYVPDGVRAENGSVLVPIRTLARAMGGRVEWSPEKGVTVTPGSGRPGSTPYTEEELNWLSRIISAESRGEPLLGKLAVGTVVMNRVASEEFPDSIYGVIFDREWGVQFTPTANGTVYLEPTEESVLAAKMVLEGARAAGDSLYFLAPDLTDNHWIMKNREYVTTIGCHWFYR